MDSHAKTVDQDVEMQALDPRCHTGTTNHYVVPPEELELDIISIDDDDSPPGVGAQPSIQLRRIGPGPSPLRYELPAGCSDNSSEHFLPSDTKPRIRLRMRQRIVQMQRCGRRVDEGSPWQQVRMQRDAGIMCVHRHTTQSFT